jgi:CTP:molybdopterin cytidylyltransferase MocA
MFADLMVLEGDKGARPLLQDAHTVEANAELVRDIDTMADLA